MTVYMNPIGFLYLIFQRTRIKVVPELAGTYKIYLGGGNRFGRPPGMAETW